MVSDFWSLLSQDNRTPLEYCPLTSWLVNGQCQLFCCPDKLTLKYHPLGPKWSDFDIDMQIKISYLTFHQLKNQDGITDWKFSFWILNSCFSILVQLQHKVWVVKLSWSRRLGSLLDSSVVLIVVSLKSESIFFSFCKSVFTKRKKNTFTFQGHYN